VKRIGKNKKDIIMNHFKVNMSFRCARNCFQCPICQNTLSVVAAQEQTQLITASSGPAPGPYFLACNVCRWSSQEIDMTFEKPTSLACKSMVTSF
jgi:uncharacterized protein YbaR (Trm112 family)